MDPTAPKDNPTSTPPNPWAPVSEPTSPNQVQTQQGPIEPGQFVAVGGNAAPPPTTPAASVLPNNPPQEDTLPPLPQMPVAQTPNGPILGATPPPTTVTPEPLLPPLPAAPPEPPASQAPQPDPTPYTPPPGSPQIQTPPEGASKIKRLRIILIAVGVLILVILIGALLWFFVLKPKPAANGAQTTSSTDVTEPSPPKKSTQGGFADLPQATAPAAQSTTSATPRGL